MAKDEETIARDHRWVRWVPLLGLIALLLAAALWPRTAWDPVEVNVVLAAESVAHDRNLTFEETDERRWREWRERLGEERIPYPALSPAGDGRFDLSAGFAGYLAAFVVVAGARGALFAQGLVLLLGLLTLVRYLRPRLFRDAPRLVVAMVGLSGLLPATLHLWPQVLQTGTVLVLLALLYGGESRADSPPNVYGGEPNRRWFEAARWIAVGTLSALLMASGPWFIGLLIPIVMALRNQRPAGFSWGAGVMAWIAVLWVSQAVRWVDRLPSSLAGVDGSLLLWSTVDLLVGRHVGILFYFAPLFWVVLCGRERGRVGLALGLVLSLGLLLLVDPYHFGGAPWAVGARGFLPLYAALWFFVDRPPRRWQWIPVAGIAVAALWPTWLSLMQPVADPGGRPQRAPSYAAPWLPWETTQVDLAAASAVQTSGIEVRILDLGAWRDAEGGLEILGNTWADLLLVSEAPVGGFRLEVAEDGGADLEIRGGSLRQSVYRPDGSVGFLVEVDTPRRRHPLPQQAGLRYFHPVTVRLSAAPKRPIAASIGGVELAPEGEGDE